MDSFTSFLQSLRLGMGRGYERPSNQARLDPETLSASVDLDDIISEYDDPGGRSRFASSHEGPTSQSYFSLPGAGPIDEETTSFYSALHDGFSLDEFELRNKYGREFFWSNTNSNNERDTMLQPSDFQITWSDLNYSIRPRHTLADLADDCRSKLIDSISSVSSILKYCKTSASYDVNGCSPKEAAKPGGRSETISILQNVNGSFKSGELTAVMGPSGAGKTSLLNILSRRREDGFTGQVHVNEANHRIRINAIPQHDHLPECFTVRENLLFASRLKNTSPNQNHEKNVTRVSNLLGLDECLDTRSRNISGGQQKRLAIAQELLSRPDILILDEPTSGLDSLTCLKTLSVLKDLVKASSRKMIEPIAVVLTIHQPQQEAFSLFDKVYVMANGGIVIYDGPPTNCADFVERYSRLKMPSDDYNPATFLIEIASGEYGQEPIEALAQQVRLEYRKERDRPTGAAVGRTNHGNDNRVTESCDSIERSSSLRSQGKTIKPSHRSGLYLDPQLAKSSSIDSGKFFAKTRILTERCWKAMWRDKRFMSGKVLLYLLLPFAMAFMLGTDPGHSNACPKYHSEYSLIGVMRGDEFTSGQVQEEFLLAVENSGGLFMLIYSCISANIAIMTLTFALDMQSCLKEYYNGWYSMNSYIFARLLSNIPINLTLPTMTIAISYVVTGQNTGGNMPDVYRIGITSLAVVLGSMVGEIMGMIFGAIYIGHITTALFASQGATLPFVLLSGFVARTKNMSKFVQVLSMTSLYKHCLEVAYIARYGWNICGCDQTQLQIKQPQLTGVSDNLRNFVRFYMNSQDSAKESATETLRSNSTTIAPATNEEADIFQMIAKQLSLYNTYGIEVKSCEQITPYLMYDFGLTERDLSASFTALVTLLLSLLIILLLVVRLVVNYRTSL